MAHRSPLRVLMVLAILALSGAIATPAMSQPCMPGSSSPTGSEPCTACSAGQFQSSSGQTTCSNCSVGTFEATRFGIGCKNANTFQIHGSGGMLRFNLERLNELEFLDTRNPPTEQGIGDLLVTDMQHPIFPNFWKPGHIIGYEHTFIAALAEFLDAVSRGVEFHPDFTDALEVQRVLDGLQRSVKSRQWTTIEA